MIKIINYSIHVISQLQILQLVNEVKKLKKFCLDFFKVLYLNSYRSFNMT